MCSLQEHFIVLSSSGCREVYPENTPTSFTNEIHPLSLDPGLVWEMAVHSVILPPDFATVLTTSDYVDICAGCVNGSTPRRTWFRIYAPGVEYFNTSVELYNYIDYFLVQGLRQELGPQAFQAFFPGDDSSYILKWDGDKRKFYCGAGSRARKSVLRSLYKDNTDFDPTVDCLTLQPCDRIRRVLGFTSDVELTIYDAKRAKPLPQYSNIPPELGSSLIDAVMLFTDTVQPLRLNDKLVNLLDVFTFTDRLGKHQGGPIYHTLQDTDISRVTIDLRDQSDAPLAIRDGYTLVTLHIRPR